MGCGPLSHERRGHSLSHRCLNYLENTLELIDSTQLRRSIIDALTNFPDIKPARGASTLSHKGLHEKRMLIDHSLVLINLIV